MSIGIGTLILLILIFGPQLWIRYIFKRYNVQLDGMPGTGGELANHLVDKLNLPDTKVEITDPGINHYDPRDKTVRLSPDVYEGKSLTAVVIAAHELGHAIQHETAYRPLYLRSQMAKLVAISEKLASMMLIAFPFVAILTRMPLVGGLMLMSGIIILFLPVLFHLITLPVEIDASFNRALPILIQGKYIPESAIPIAKRILTAAALTYLSASLASILNFYRWLVFLRR